jgi:hypothetical protein
MTFTTTPDVERYLAAVRDELRDLPDAEREDLLRDVEPSLAEAADESDAPLETRLGPPSEFAAELRASAGLPPVPVGAPVRPPTVRERLAVLAGSRHARVAWSVTRELAPLWWLIRGYVVAYALARLAGATWSTTYPAVPRIADGADGLGLILLACIASLAWGVYWRRRRRTRWPAAVAANLLLLAGAVPALAHLADATRRAGTAPAVVTAVTYPVPIGSAIHGVVLDPPHAPRTATVLVANTGRVTLDRVVVRLYVHGAWQAHRTGRLQPGRTAAVPFMLQMPALQRTYGLQAESVPVPGEQVISNNSFFEQFTVTPRAAARSHRARATARSSARPARPSGPTRPAA